MKKHRLSILVFAVCIILISTMLCMCGCGKSAKPSGDTFQVGILMAMTGWFAPFDMLSMDEYELMAEMINEDGGIKVKGKQYDIELTVEDYKSNLDGVTAATSRLVYDKKVQYICGPAAFFSSATAAICEPNKVIHVLGACTCTPGEMDATTPYAFLAKNATVGHAYAVFNYLAQEYPEVKTVVMVTAAPGTQGFWLPQVERAAQENGITIVGEPVSFPDDMVDYSPIAAKLKAIEADAIYMQLGIASHMGAILKGVRELGDNRLFAAAIASNPEELIGIAGKESATNAFTLAPMQGAQGNTEQCEEFIKRIRDRHGADRAIIMEGVNGLMLISQAIEKAQTFDSEEVKNTWENMGTAVTLWGKGTIGGEESYGIGHAFSHRQSISMLDESGNIKFGGWVDVDIP